MQEMTLRELQLFALEILKDVNDFCSKNHIKYSLYGGSMLGAVRHHGFIPWDDDIDLVMPREDYEKFCSLYHSDKYILTNRAKDSSFQLAYARVCDVNRTLYKAVEPCSKHSTGVWIDVFPADGCPPAEEDIPGFYKYNSELFHETEKVRWTLLPLTSVFGRYGFVKTIKELLSLSYRKMYYQLTEKKHYWVNKLIETNKTYPFGSTSHWSCFTFFYKHPVYFPQDTFARCDMMSFEDASFPVMCGWDAVLSTLYGDYMQFPPAEQQKPPMGPWYTFYWKQKS